MKRGDGKPFWWYACRAAALAWLASWSAWEPLVGLSPDECVATFSGVRLIFSECNRTSSWFLVFVEEQTVRIDGRRFSAKCLALLSRLSLCVLRRRGRQWFPIDEAEHRTSPLFRRSDCCDQFEETSIPTHLFPLPKFILQALSLCKRAPLTALRCHIPSRVDLYLGAGGCPTRGAPPTIATLPAPVGSLLRFVVSVGGDERRRQIWGLVEKRTENAFSVSLQPNFP